MVAIPSVRPGEHVPTADQRIVLHRVPWSHYEAQLAFRGDASAPRISYLDGEMELRSPSKDHERIKSYLGRLVEAFALERGIDLSPYGSWTLKEAPKQAGVEPDECYLIGSDQRREIPDLVIEVIWTSGGIDKLEAYRRLGVPEVWFWKDDALQVFVRKDAGYEASARSSRLPELDLMLLISHLDHPTAMQAVRAFRSALSSR
ncbi:MAG TPA: Uma2 family endonuclease [Labilithrix sp.]|jgi:Uma2 family endonuclease|nr:Uma2 family endonuclease [Labilithrix sp.]